MGMHDTQLLQAVYFSSMNDSGQACFEIAVTGVETLIMIFPNTFSMC